MAPDYPRILLCILRRDIRLADNPILHFASQPRRTPNTSKSPSNSETRSRDDSLLSEHTGPNFTHLLPVYVFPANQVEVSGFLKNPADQCPYPEARSQVAKVWRTGPHRAKFIAEGAWDLKQKLAGLGCGSGLELRVGRVGDVVSGILEWYKKDASQGGNNGEVSGIWMTSDYGTEEKDDEQEVKTLAEENDVDFRIWEDEKFYIDDRDLPFEDISKLPNVYTTYRKSLEPLRDRPKKPLPAPTTLPPLPPNVPPQSEPFSIPTSLDGLRKALLKPLEQDSTFGLAHPPTRPQDMKSVHPFEGGETVGLDRISHLISTGAMSSYKATRNGMLGLDFSTKLSAFLAQGYITARQVHWAMIDFEEGRGPGKSIEGYGKGENEGTAAVRFELLWRDYMRLCMRKFRHRMFALYGIQDHKGEGKHDGVNPRTKEWKTVHTSNRKSGSNAEMTWETFGRFRSGRTGIGLIDASNRELFLTGYTSNRARQNVASFLASHLDIDWRIGAEWYECMLIDYDVASNWGNWQYVAGVGNDPRQGRIFNPVKQALDYDARGEYIKAWVPELRGIKLTRQTRAGDEEMDPQRLMCLYQAWRLSDWEKSNLGLKGIEWVEHPLTRIQFSVARGRGGQGEGRPKRGGGGGGGGGGPWRGRGKRPERTFRRMGQEDRVANGGSIGEPVIVSSERS